MGCSSTSSISANFPIKVDDFSHGGSIGNIKISDSQAAKLSGPALFPRSLKQYKKTHYFKQFDKTSRSGDLGDAVSELKSLFVESGLVYQAGKIQNTYDQFSEYTNKCVTMIWTSDIVIAALINCALIVDAANSYSNISEDDFSFYYKFLKDKNLNYKTIINKSMKYMRILNSCIVDIGTFSNEDDRVTY